jgi:predicted acylesterase/phospholipase RssA
MAENPKFEIGLTMAGAISAGAYTAGAIDFLFEALDAIEDVRAGRDTSYLEPDKPNPVFNPPHDVTISAMSGTSAGSMVTAIVAAVLGTRIKPIEAKRAVTDDTSTGNPLYDAWVNDIHYTYLLSNTDLKSKKEITSVLNSDRLDEIVSRTLKFATVTEYIRPYVSDPLSIYFCISNLRGVCYSLDLDAEKDVPNEYQMSMHADWIGFNWSSSGGSREGYTSITPGGDEKSWSQLGNAALASGAFPLGLAARALDRSFLDYENREWFIPGALLPPRRKKDKDGNDVEPAESPSSWESRAGEFQKVEPYKAKIFEGSRYEFVNVDGGVFNNEPLELVRRELAGKNERNPRDARIAKRCVILIDPFPNTSELKSEFSVKAERGLLTVVKRLLAAMVAQSRFKLEELSLAKDPDVASRKAIMPVRYDSMDKAAKFPLACGSLGGFGGFLSKAFRHHDYMLGRRNCQRFLSDHLVLPYDLKAGITNDLFAGWDEYHISKFKVERTVKIGGEQRENLVHLPIIPLLGKLARSEYTALPLWPRKPLDVSRMALREAILDRAGALKEHLIENLGRGWKLGIRGIWWWKEKDWAERALKIVDTSLKTRDIRLD